MVTVIRKSDAHSVQDSPALQAILEAQKFSALQAALLHIEAARAQVSSVLAVSQPPPPPASEPKEEPKDQPKKEESK